MKPGQLIKKHREHKDMTQKELALSLGYSIPQFISLIENGHSQIPLSIAYMLAVALDIPVPKMKRALVNEYTIEVDKALNIGESK